MSVAFGRPALPVIFESDVAAVGGSFGGGAAAWALGRAGRSVTLVEPPTYLGREVTATLRPWARIPSGDTSPECPELLTACIVASGTSPAAGQIPLHMRAVKVRLEDMLFSAGVNLVYASIPVGICMLDGAIGQVEAIRALLSYNARYNPSTRAYANALGGGGILDVGCYTASMASHRRGGGRGSLCRGHTPVRDRRHRGGVRRRRLWSSQ